MKPKKKIIDAAIANGSIDRLNMLLSAAGNQGAASATGKDSIALAAGYRCKAKGAIGCWIVLAERGRWSGDTYPIKEVKAFEVDGEKVKADTWYMLVNGQLKEV